MIVTCNADKLTVAMAAMNILKYGAYTDRFLDSSFADFNEDDDYEKRLLSFRHYVPRSAGIDSLMSTTHEV